MVRTKLHEQVRRGIEKLIIDRALKPGNQLPTESELASAQCPEGIRAGRQNRAHARAMGDCPAASLVIVASHVSLK